MTRISDLVSTRKVYTIDADQTVFEAVRLMSDHRIGALPVLRGGELVGMFSERDVMTRVVAAGRSPGTTRVSEVMTPNPQTVSSGESLQNCLFIMREFGFRHLPVCDDKALKGLVSLRDIVFRELESRKTEVA
jgi:CBS domain-containing protein